MNTAPSTSLRVLIVDDEAHGRDVVRHMLRMHPDVAIVGEAGNGITALEQIRSTKPDLLFLDIKMPKLSGLELLRALPQENPPIVIFTTAYDEYAVAAFERSALDYLLKPFDQERFDAALNRARAVVANARAADFGRRLRDLLAENAVLPGSNPAEPRPNGGKPGDPLSRFVLKEAGRVTFLAVEAVDWLEASGNYVGLHVGTKTHLIHQTLADVEQALDPKRFLRIHRSTIVNVSRIKELQPYANGEFVVILNDGTKLKLSRSFRDRANSVLGLST
jgi:two-component system, LytTR family, response regulator